MNEFLENEAMRRQNETMTRLTVVTTFGLIATIATGFLGMNIFDWANEPASWRATAFALTLSATSLLMIVTLAKSRRLAEFLEHLSDDTTGFSGKLRALGWLFRRRRDD
jgi:Mg2+ and Co2+ transporter CorA